MLYGLNENGSQGLIYLNNWFTFSGTVLEDYECDLVGRWALRFQMPMTSPVSLCVCVSLSPIEDQDITS